ncbi:MAG: hypothetical protein Tsb0034_15870 [Ekhidna sp.]
MKKFLIIIAILLLAGAGYFTYEKWVKHSDLSAWSFIPSDAALVFELDLLSDYRTISSYPVWRTLRTTSSFSGIEKGIAFLDSINGKGGFSAIFDDANVLISTHKVSSNDVDFLYVLDIQNISQNTFVGAAMGRLQENGYRFRTRKYNGFKISEISKKDELFTCIFYKNFLLASFTPYLVEDAIRTIEEGSLGSFQNTFLAIEDPLSEGLFNAYVNYEQVSSLMSGISSQRINLPLRNGNYTLSMDSSYLHLSGFSFADEGWLATHNRSAGDFDMAEIIPENTATLLHITSADMEEWKRTSTNFIRESESATRSFQDSLISTFDFHPHQVLDLVDEEIALLTMESASQRDRMKMCILEVKDMPEALSFFGGLTERVALSRGDSVYSESYSENEIRFLPIQDFPRSFLGEMGASFGQSFYLSYRNYLIFSNNLQELKNLIIAIQNEDTWGKSLRMNDFLQRTNQTANVSLFINVPRAWNLLDESLSGKWRKTIKADAQAYKSFELIAFQFSYADSRYFTNFTFSQPEQRPRETPKTNIDRGVQFASNLISKPYLLRTHAHRDFDILVQDSSSTIYYLDQHQTSLWSEQIEDPIISDVFPIDYYKNGKIQYAFATTKSIHIWDRTGEAIPGFPKQLPGNVSLAHFNLIDYDKSRNYRMAITDTEGNVYLTDKDLKQLDGWSPRKFMRPAHQALTHARLGRRDIMINTQEDGVIYVTNRRGENMRGFPFKTNHTLDKNYFLRSSNALSNSSLTVLSKAGELTEINLEGDVVKRDQLLKTTVNASFSLLPDRGQKSFLIVRKEGNSYEILDDTGNLLFKKDYLSNEPILIQYYHFGAGKDLVAFTDTANKSLYIYDKSGNLVTGNPLRSENEVSIIYSSAKREFQVFTTHGANLELYTFSF